MKLYRKSAVQRLLAGYAGLLIILAVGCAKTTPPTPPVAAVVPHADTLHGEIRIDNYHWLRERSNPDVLAYLEAENEYTAAIMKHTEPLQEELYNEMLGRIKETDLSVPVKIDEYYYYTRTEEGQQYKIHARKRGSLEAPEEVILDENKLAAGRDFFRIDAFEISPDHHLLAYAVDTAGSEQYTIYIKNLATGETYDDQIPHTYADIAWANDDRTLFYTTLDHAKRPYRLYRHSLGDDPQNDKLIYQENDEAFWLDVSRTKSKAYILLNLASETTSEVYFLPADRPKGEFQVVSPRTDKIEYKVDHHDQRFLIVTNDNATNFKLVDAPVSNPGRNNWREIIPARDSVKIDGIDIFQEFMAVYERENGLRQITVYRLADGRRHRITFPENDYTFRAMDNPDFNSHILRFTYTSLITPKSVYDYDMVTRNRELKKQEEVLGGYDPSQYRAERVFATAPDGVRIPISLVYKKGLEKNGANPTLLYGYGAYGSSSEPRFHSNNLSFLDRGFIKGIAHVRGGGEMGRYWYDDGKMLHKKNTFTDFIACAEYLIDQGYTSSDKLAIGGGSAGGLLIGAVVNMRPDLFNVAIADVPFVDIINTMADSTIPLTVVEYDEWGNPADEEYYRYMLSYSPYDNVTAQAYPNMLITAGLNDPRVQYWEPAKWTAKLRASKTDANILILKTNMGAGHMGASGRYDYLKDVAFETAFVLDRLGITK